MSLVKRSRKLRPLAMPQILGVSKIITVPSNNTSSFSASNNVIRFAIPSAMNKQISPYKTPRMTFQITYSNDTNSFVNPYLSMESIIYQVTTSSASKGIVIHQARNYARSLQSTELDNMGFNELATGLSNEIKCCYDYQGQKQAMSFIRNVVTPLNVSVPLYTWFLDNTPDLASLDLQALGGLNIEVQLSYNPTFFIDGSGANVSYSISNVKLHYDLLDVIPTLPSGNEIKELFFRAVDCRQDSIQASTEAKSIRVNASNVEGLIVDAVNASNANSLSGDSFVNAKLVAQTAVSGYNVPNTNSVAGYTGLTEFRESVNGLSVPLNQIYNVPDSTIAVTNSNTGLSNILRETMKSQNRSAYIEYGKTLENLYTYDNVKIPQGLASVNSNPLYNPASLVTNTFVFGVLPVPKFKFGFLNRAGGSRLAESNLSYKINESLGGTAYNVFHHILQAKRLCVGGDGQLQMLE